MPDITPPTPTTPSAPPAAAPSSAPSTPLPSTAPVAPPMTPTPPTPPAPPMTSTPSAATPTASKPEHSRLGPLIGFFVIILAACILLLTHNWSAQPSSTPTPNTSTNQTIVIPPPVATSTVPETNTSTLETATTTVMSTTTQTLPLYQVGSIIRFFAGDVVEMQNTTTSHTWTVTALELTDSRCPQNVVCIWAGERGVHLRVQDSITGQTQDVMLGTMRTKSVDALDLHFVLQTIDDAKGGTYADVLIK